jgi:DNA-binding Lrp family transcriptional regulator
MLLNACILTKTMPTRTEKILKAVKEFKEVRKAFMAYGRFDVVVFVEVSDYQQVRVISGKINSIDGVRSTETLVEA